MGRARVPTDPGRPQVWRRKERADLLLAEWLVAAGQFGEAERYLDAV